MSEIEFLQSGPGINIATHLPCAIDSGFESLDRLYHLWFPWDARPLTLAGRRSATQYMTSMTDKHPLEPSGKPSRPADRCCQGQPIYRKDRSTGQWALRSKRRYRRPPSHYPLCSAHHPTVRQSHSIGTLSERAVGSSALQTLTSLPRRHAALAAGRLGPGKWRLKSLQLSPHGPTHRPKISDLHLQPSLT